MVIDYKRYIKSAKWRKKRIAIILRADGMCERCRAWPIVCIHHLSYEHVGDEPLDELLGVCLRCHKELHP